MNTYPGTRFSIAVLVVFSAFISVSIRGSTFAGTAGTAPHLEPESLEALSQVYTIDRIYRSMEGPQSQQTIRLVEGDAPPELLWITGYRAEMVGADGETPMPQEFMCHSNLNIVDTPAHAELFHLPENTVNPRFFTLSQGQLQIRFPDGFGIPVMSNEILGLRTQVLNLNYPEGTRQVRHKIHIDFVRDRDLRGRRFIPLYPASANVRVSLKGKPAARGSESPTANRQEANCLPGHAVDKRPGIADGGQRLSGHFVVSPGRHVYRTLATKQLDVPYDTTIHYVAVHLHPYAESIELRDVTANESLYKSHARGFSDRIGLDSVDHYAAPKGFPIYKDHQYEIVAVYDNTTEQPSDAMAVMFVYIQDHEFKKTSSSLAQH